jgi:hypothetical protein
VMAQSRAFKFTSSGRYSERFDTVDGDAFGSTNELASAEVAAGHGVDVSDIEVVIDPAGSDPRGSDMVRTVITWDELESRGRRNEKLSACDWTQGQDSPLSDAKRAEWATYRQALRDLPSNTPDVNGLEWPVTPS